jgi:hypothetical protein
LVEECNWLREENLILAWNAVELEGQAGQAKAREELLLEGWVFWERRARTLEEIGWRTGAWEWIAWMVSRGGFQDTHHLQVTAPRPQMVEIVEVNFKSRSSPPSTS